MEILRVRLNSTQIEVVVEVRVELGNSKQTMTTNNVLTYKTYFYNAQKVFSNSDSFSKVFNEDSHLNLDTWDVMLIILLMY